MSQSNDAHASPSRRRFLGTTAAAGSIAAGYWIAPASRAAAAPTSANEEIRFACIGTGGKGQSDSADAGRLGKVVAVADVDANQLKRAAQAFKDAKQFSEIFCRRQGAQTALARFINRHPNGHIADFDNIVPVGTPK